jgi:threonine/homoserine/homoserine lactone efflux protein
MPELSTLGVFALSSLAILLLPGPAMLYVITRTVEHGRAAGLVSVLGIQAGALVHIVAAAVGLSAVLASSPAAMTGIRLGGAAYLIHLGIQRLRTASGGWVAGAGSPAGRRHLFLQGLLVDALNPKTAMFFLAFLPQFVDPERGAVSVQVLVLGGCFVALALLSDGACALGAGAIRERLTAGAGTRRRMDRGAGAALLGLGVFAALAG